MRLQTLLFAWVIAAPTAFAAQAIQDPNLTATPTGQGGGEIYAWTPMLDRIPMNAPYMSFHVQKGGDSGAVEPTIVLNVKTTAPLDRRCATSAIEIGGNAISPARSSTVTARLPQAGVLEIRSKTVSLDTLRAIVEPGDVEYVICGMRSKISSQEREGLKKVIGLFDGTLRLSDEFDHPLMRRFAPPRSPGGATP